MANASFTPVVDAAGKEWAEQGAAQNELQKRKAERRAAASALSDGLVGFRRVIRAVYGSESKE